jgi:hypothetical protein
MVEFDRHILRTLIGFIIVFGVTYYTLAQVVFWFMEWWYVANRG